MKLLTAALFLLSTTAFALESGSAAPDFIAAASDGKNVKLSDYKGKTVVLEWLNYGCPFVRKHYNGKNMQALQADYTKKGVVWLSVISSAEGKEGYSTPKQAEADRKAHDSHATAILLDAKGEVGKLYGAQSTPHMFVIDKAGKLAYQGAIDDKPSTELATLKGAHNYVRDALDAVLAGRAPATAQTKSYGCGVKY
ncbi:MAG: thioredoxin family protein [Bdellovibrionota bacterium]